MLSLFKSSSSQPKSPVAPSGTPDVPDMSISLALGEPADEAEPRTSSASVPTIASTPTIQGSPVDAPQVAPPLPKPVPTPVSASASLVPPSPAMAPSVLTQSTVQSDRPMQSQSQSALPYSSPSANPTGKDPRRFSFPSFSFLRSDTKSSKARTAPPPLKITVSKPSDKKSKPVRTLSVLIVGSAASSEKRARESANIARSVILGNHNIPDSQSNKTKYPSKSDIARVKTHLLEPKTAAKVIANLRALPSHPDNATANPHPIHAVCLDMTDQDACDQYFSQFSSVATASVSAVSTVLTNVHVVNLLTAPNMGFGAPVTAQGLFAGAVPTAETIIEGIEQITPQLLALGYATGKAIIPDHKGIVVPVDRISAIAYWWGFEICLPPPTLAYLQAAQSPGIALLNLLTAISLLNEGVREILPFIRYIAQFVQSEWSTIKKCNKGKGVICTATWLMPVALVPRPWDFPDPPPPRTDVADVGQSTPTSPSVKRFSATLTTPKPSTELPNNNVPRSSSAYSTETKDEDESHRPAISSQPPVLPEVVVSSPGSIDGAHQGSGDEEVHDTYERVQHDGEATAH